MTAEDRPAQGSPSRSRTPSPPRRAASSDTTVTEAASGGEARGRRCNGRDGRASHEGEEDARNGASSGSGLDEGESTWITSVLQAVKNTGATGRDRRGLVYASLSVSHGGDAAHHKI